MIHYYLLQADVAQCEPSDTLEGGTFPKEENTSFSVIPRIFTSESPGTCVNTLVNTEDIEGVAPADSPFNLVLNVKMPYTRAEFHANKQNKFKEAMAGAAAVPSGNVDIVSITEGRRRLAKSVTEEMKLHVKDKASLEALASTLGTVDAAMLAKINAELAKRGLPLVCPASASLKSSATTLAGFLSLCALLYLDPFSPMRSLSTTFRLHDILRLVLCVGDCGFIKVLLRHC